MQSVLPTLLIAVALATLLNVLLKRFHMPTVIGYIITGVVLASVFGVDLHASELLQNIAEFGVVFLMFTIGLEFSVPHLKSMKREVFILGFLQVVVTGTVLALASHLIFAVPHQTAIFIGAALALSSTAIVLKILNESGQLRTVFGRNALGILVFQDIAVIPILLMIAIFTNTDKSLTALLSETALHAAIVLGILIALGKYVIGRFFRVISDTKSNEIYMGSILLTVVGASYLSHSFGFSYSLGGFLAGMMIADTIYKYQIEADLIPFRDLLLGVFFVSIGLQIDLQVVLQNSIQVVLLTVAIMTVKTMTLFLIVSWSSNKKVALNTAIALAQIGEFSLVVFSLISANRMLDSTSVQVMLVTIVLSMILTPLLISHLDTIVRLLIRSPLEMEPLDQSSLLGGHVILLGYDAFGRAVSERLDDAQIEHVIVTNSTDAYVRAREAGKNVVFGDVADRALLHDLDIQKAMSTILAVDDIDTVKRASTAIAQIDPKLRVFAKVPSNEDRRDLEAFQHELLLDGNSHTASLVVNRIARSILLAKETSELHFMADYSIAVPERAIDLITQEQGRLLEIISKSFNALRENRDIMHIKAFHESFSVLSEIIENAIRQIMAHASLSPDQYEQINTLMDNQRHLMLMSSILEELGKELKVLGAIDRTKSLAGMAVEGLDIILMSLMDLAHDYNDEDMEILKSMTSSKGTGLSRIRESYLKSEIDLKAENRALLISATNHMDRLKALFGSLGENYRKLALAA